MAMLNERARLLASVPLDDSGRCAATSDLLRRHAGPFHAQKLKQVFDLIDAGCSGEASRFATCEDSSGSSVASPSTLGPRVEGEKE